VLIWRRTSTLIVDVEPNEAQKLIELIELLIKDWYINRQQRTERLNAMVGIKDAKETTIIRLGAKSS
jgi:hypothetical protein